MIVTNSINNHLVEDKYFTLSIHQDTQLFIISMVSQTYMWVYPVIVLVVVVIQSVSYQDGQSACYSLPVIVVKDYSN